MNTTNSPLKTRLLGVFLCALLLISPAVASADVFDDMSASLLEAATSLSKIMNSLSSLSVTQQAQVTGTSPTITSFSASTPNSTNQGFMLSWQISAASDLKVNFSCPINSIKFFLPNYGKTVGCDNGELASYINQGNGSIFIQPQGNTESVTPAFFLTLFKNGVQVGVSKMITVVIPPTSSTTTSPTITSFSATTPDAANTFWIQWQASDLVDAKLDFSCPINSIKFYLPLENRTVDCSTGKLTSYTNQMSGKIEVLAQGNTESVTPAFFLTLFKNGVQVGVSKMITVVIPPTSTTTTSPTITAVGTPTLALTYDSAGKEAALSATFDVTVTAGSTNFKLYKYGVFDADTHAFLVTLNNANGANNSASNGNFYKTSGTATDNITYWTIPAGQTAAFRVTSTLSSPNTLFSGSYNATISMYKLSGSGSDVGNIQNNTTNSVTIIGERAPYINSVSTMTDVSGAVIGQNIWGVRFHSTSNQVTINGVTKTLPTGASDKGPYITFKSSDFNITSSGSYMIQVSTAEGASNKHYAIITVPTTTTPTLTVLSPNGGETWTIGSTQKISWTWTGSPTEFRIQLLSEGTPTQKFELVPDGVESSLGNYSFVVPASLTPDKYIISVCDSYYAAGTFVCDSSNTPFNITSSTLTHTLTVVGTPTLALTYDSVGKEAQLTANFTVKITAGSQALSFRAGVQPVSVYIAGTNNQESGGQVSLTTNGPTTIPAGTSATYNIKVTANPNQLFAGTYFGAVDPYIYPLDSTGTYSISIPASISGTTKTNPVTIIGERAPYISNITSDANGNVTVTGARFDLIGNVFLIDGKSIVGGMKGGATSWPFNASIYGLTNGSHYIQIINSQEGNSNTRYFTVDVASQPSPTPTLTVLSPNGGETLFTGSTKTITWTSSSVIDKVSIGYSTGPGSLNWIANNIPNTNSYNWTVNVGNTTNTQFKIWMIGYQTGTGSVTDESDNFFSVHSITNKTDLEIFKLCFGKYVSSGDSCFKSDFDASGFINITDMGALKSASLSDLNSDNIADLRDTTDNADLNFMKSCLGVYTASSPSCVKADLVVNGVVNAIDLAKFKSAIKYDLNGDSRVDLRESVTSVPTPTITVLSPNGGESFSSSQQLTISFKPIPGQKIYINLADSNNAGHDLLSFNSIASLIGISADKQTVALNLPISWISSHGNNYKIEVCSVNICDRSDNYFTITSSVDTIPPSTPTALSAIATTTSYSFPAVILSWNSSTDNVGVMGYRIYRDGVLYTTVNHSSIPTHSHQNGVGLSWGTTYSYAVSAFDAAGNTSPQSEVISITTVSGNTNTSPDLTKESLKAQILSLLAKTEALRAQLTQCRIGSNASLTSEENIVVQNAQSIVLATSVTTVDELQKHTTLLLNIINRLNAQILTCQNTTPTPPVITPPVTQPPVIQPPVLTERNLYRGMRGESVRKLQELLSKDPQIYPNGQITGYFGYLTEAAVQNFQCKYGIVCDGDPETTGYGIVGPKTMTKINEVASSMSGGSTGNSGTVTSPPQSGNTVADLQAQIKLLMEQVSALTAKLNALPR